MEMHHFARAGRAESCVCRIDRNAVANELLRENGIGNALERPDYTGERRAENKRIVTHFA